MFISCKGKDGAVGPAGAKGDPGAQGTAGAKGETGTANVIYSEWLAIPAPAANTPVRKNFSFMAPKITQEIVDKGHVYGYLKHSTGAVVPLPYASSYTYTSTGEQAGSYLNTILVGLGGISLNQDWLTPGTVQPAFANATGIVGGYVNFRYVIIPGGVSARVASLDYTDYEAVKKFYNLPD
ncbi:hypothetical protein DYBT9275_04259 [Dyadobacter sp. CECT 9275]|uniref:Collagen-like protein n=2 Tax=Dyadobacter helix TaxID=2822344 RepID=A0A916N655_9BACT|nr:hypothetical protein DYBT9275_04259 [Dyadobacter sp. CECT 9275]